MRMDLDDRMHKVCFGLRRLLFVWVSLPASGMDFIRSIYAESFSSYKGKKAIAALHNSSKFPFNPLKSPLAPL